MGVRQQSRWEGLIDISVGMNLISAVRDRQGSSNVVNLGVKPDNSCTFTTIIHWNSPFRPLYQTYKRGGLAYNFTLRITTFTPDHPPLNKHPRLGSTYQIVFG